jgi:tRNA-Thr(GGU) m(6)t(6)A37 methyltransferase TsaA
MECHPIGTIHSPYTEPQGMPIQTSGGAGVRGTVEVFEDFRRGLEDLDGFSHILLLYQFHRHRGYRLRVVPFMDTRPRGLFATRAPRRPNPIGLSLVRLRRIEGPVLHVEDLDILDGTPLLDIKPFVPEFDTRTGARTGWIEKARGGAAKLRSDDRFNG